MKQILILALISSATVHAGNARSWQYLSSDKRVRVSASCSNTPLTRIELRPPDGYSIRPELPDQLVVTDTTRTYAAKVLGLIERSGTPRSFWSITETSVVRLKSFGVSLAAEGIVMDLRPEPDGTEGDGVNQLPAFAMANRFLDTLTFVDTIRVTYEFFRTVMIGSHGRAVSIPTVMGSFPFERNCLGYLGRISSE